MVQKFARVENDQSNRVLRSSHAKVEVAFARRLSSRAGDTLANQNGAELPVRETSAHVNEAPLIESAVSDHVDDGDRFQTEQLRQRLLGRGNEHVQGHGSVHRAHKVDGHADDDSRSLATAAPDSTASGSSRSLGDVSMTRFVG